MKFPVTKRDKVSQESCSLLILFQAVHFLDPHADIC